MSKFSMIVFSGTEDKMIPVGVLSQAAAAMGYEVRVFVTGWALLRFLRNPPPPTWSKEFEQYVPRLAKGMEAAKAPTWADMLRQARSMGAKVYACSMMSQAMGLGKDDYDASLIDDVVGAAAFLQESEGGQVIFI